MTKMKEPGRGRQVGRKDVAPREGRSASCPDESQKVCRIENKESVTKAGIESEIEQTDAGKVEYGNKFCGRLDVVQCVQDIALEWLSSQQCENIRLA